MVSLKEKFLVEADRSILDLKKDMTKGKEWKLILLFTLPIMAGNLLQQLYNTADGVIVGNFVSEAAFAAVGTTQPLTFLFLSFAIGLSVGVGVVISQYFGAGRHEDLASAIDTSLIMLGILGVAFTLIAWVTTPFLLDVVLSVPEGPILDQAIVYFRIYCLGLFFQFIYNGISYVLRGVGDSKATLYFLMISALLNVGLDLLFVIVFHWDVAGAAIATVISQAACAAVSYIYLRRRFAFVKGGVHFDKAVCKTMLRLGLPVAVQQSIVAFGNTAMQRLANGFGETTIAALSAGNRITSFIFIPIMGFQSGLANFAGQNIGAGEWSRAKRGYWVTHAMAVAVTVVTGAALFFFAEPVVSLFGLSGASLARGVEQIKFLAPLFLVFASYMALGGLLQGAGDTILLSIATLLALAVRVVLGYLFVHIGWMGYNAVWATFPIGWVCALITVNLRYYTGGWKKKAITGKKAVDMGPTD